MSANILFKFRSGKTFENLPLTGSAARLLDVKRAIVNAKNLGGGLEFDLEIKDATTGQEYADDAMVLPRGARLVVQRLPAAKGHGILAKLARASAGMTGIADAAPNEVPSDFYTVQGSANDDDEFVSANQVSQQQQQSDKELEALRAVTSGAGGPVLGTTGRNGMGRGGSRIAGSGMPPPNANHHLGGMQRRPHADPELREAGVVKKRATGIPRTFLSLQAESDNVLKPNAAGLEELKNRGGGQSESAAGNRRTFEYALSLTDTVLPEHLQCAICNKIIKDAMLVPWDPEGRNTCERCIRDALAQSGCTCPLTGQEGVSPDDLMPNIAIRKAADVFSEKVWSDAREIEEQRVEEVDDVVEEAAETGAVVTEADEKGVLVSKKLEKRKTRDSEDAFGVDDEDFGGDVFAIEKPEEVVEEPVKTEEKSPVKPSPKPTIPTQETKKPVKIETGPQPAPAENQTQTEKMEQPSPEKAEAPPRRERRRGPPVGYAMGPAGGGMVLESHRQRGNHDWDDRRERDRDDRRERDRDERRERDRDDRRERDRDDRRDRDMADRRDRNREDPRDEREHEHRGNKRPRSDSGDNFRRGPPRDHRGGGYRGGRGDRGGFRGRWEGGRGGFRGRGFRGGRGRY